MKELILQNELTMSTGVGKSIFKKKRLKRFNKVYSHVFFGGDHHLVQDYCHQVLLNIPKVKVNKTLPSAADLAGSRGRAAIFFGVDCTDLTHREENLEMLGNFADYMAKRKGSRMVVDVLLPEIPAIPDDVHSLAEREFNYFIEQCIEPTPEFSYYLEVEKLCRTFVRDRNLTVNIIRFSNVFAPDRAHMPSFDLVNYIKKVHETRKVEISDEDARHVISISYVRNTIHAVYLLFFKGIKGHVYNGDRQKVSLATLKRTVWGARKDLFALSLNVGPESDINYHALGNMKLGFRGKLPKAAFGDGIKHMVSYLTEEDYDNSNKVAIYGGKIGRIQSLEMRMLAEIDRICQENGIKYFLAGGSLLGAVRSGGAIPWDDDLDIGMLRDDFEKFRKVCPDALHTDFAYSGPKSGSHYTIHKVRLNDTYFSTKFSGKNAYHDGVFIDLLIYDRTSNIKLFQRLHSLVLTALTDVMLIKWYGVPRKKFHYRFSKRFMPLLKAIPWSFLHGTFDIAAKWYRHKKNARYLIDSVGKKVNANPLPNLGLDDVVYVDFDGMKAPIPVDPIPYLEYAYGPNYMQKPPFNKQSVPHNFSRIDLGRHVFASHEGIDFRGVDVRGELYEAELEDAVVSEAEAEGEFAAITK